MYYCQIHVDFINSGKEESIIGILIWLMRRKFGSNLVVSGCLSERYRDEA